MLKRTTLLVALVATVSAQRPLFSFSSGGPHSSSPFSDGPPPNSPFRSGGPSFSSGGPPSSFFSSGGPSSSPFSSGGPPSSIFSSGPSSSSPFNSGLLGRPGGGRPPKGPKSSPSNKLFSWLGSTMSKLQGLGPKITYHPAKPNKPSSLSSLYSSGGPPQYSSGGPPQYSSGGLSQYSSGGPPQYSSGGPSQYSSGGPSHSSILNSLFDSGSSSPFGGGSTVTFASPNSIDHPPVHFRNPGGPPSQGFGPQPSFASSRPPPSFSARPPPSPSFGPGGPSPFTSASYLSSQTSSPYGSGSRGKLEVYPSQQVSYQSETLTQNEPGYENPLGGSLQSLYESQRNNAPFQHNSSPLNYEQQSSFTQGRPQVAKNAQNNYGATFHSIEPVRVAPVYDVTQQQQQQFRPSELSSSGSSPQPTNIHDTPFSSIVNDYAAQADAITAGSEQMISALQEPDMATAASTHQGMQIMGQGMDGNPIFEVVADANAPTYDGHPVDLNKLISMIEPGAQIDTIPNYADALMGGSEQQPIYAQAPSNFEMEADAAMSGKKAAAPHKKPFIIAIPENNIRYNNINDQLEALASESRPTVVKLDGTRLSDEQLIKEHFDKEIVLDDLQDSKDHDFIIVGVPTGDDTRHPDQDDHLHGPDNNNNNNKNINKDDMLAIVQQLRNSASSASLDKLKNGSSSAAAINTVDSNEEDTTHTTHHPNHNYYPELSATQILDGTVHYDDMSSEKLPVINPIVDSVRTTIFRDDADNNTTNSEDDSPSSAQLSGHIRDYDDEMLPDDMVISEEGDLAASGSRNIKSVAIIVTPPPNYVKIRNKFKKASIPLSAMTSTTASPTATVASSDPAAFRGSVASNTNLSSDRSKSEDSAQSSIPTNHPTSSSQDNLPMASSSSDDLTSNFSTSNSGIVDSSQYVNINGRARVESSKQIRQFPVYRGRNTA